MGPQPQRNYKQPRNAESGRNSPSHGLSKRQVVIIALYLQGHIKTIPDSWKFLHVLWTTLNAKVLGILKQKSWFIPERSIFTLYLMTSSLTFPYFLSCGFHSVALPHSRDIQLTSLKTERKIYTLYPCFSSLRIRTPSLNLG